MYETCLQIGPINNLQNTLQRLGQI